MKLSCNGCRVLRKGCSDNCTIKPCLEWISSAESQANATLFLAKIYGRTGLLNLINNAPQNLGPAAFRSLLYEACGRIVNPVYGSLGLFWTGEWARCQAAVDAVLKGSEINGVAASDWDTTGTHDVDNVFPANAIRHVSGVNDLRGRTRFKRSKEVIKPKSRLGSVDSATLWNRGFGSTGSGSHEHGSKEGSETESMLASLGRQEEPNQTDKTDVNLELTLGSWLH